MNTRDPLLISLFVLIWVITIGHYLAETYYLYWVYRWLDIPMHFIGGAWVGLASLWIWRNTFRATAASRVSTHPLLVVLVGGFVLGIVWELFEYVMWILGGTGLPPRYVPDTLLDLLMDLVGAGAGYSLLSFFEERSRTKVSAVR